MSFPKFLFHDALVFLLKTVHCWRNAPECLPPENAHARITLVLDRRHDGGGR